MLAYRPLRKDLSAGTELECFLLDLRQERLIATFYAPHFRQAWKGREQMLLTLGRITGARLE